jgi:mono/diheme cytochrome c family protein
VKVATAPSHGSTVALTYDDSRLVTANRDTGTSTVFSVDYSATLPALTKLAELTIGAEPSAVVVHPNNDTAFVLARKDQKLVKITGLQSTPVVAGQLQVGSEPTGLALTPLGTTAWVANWVDGTLLGVDTNTMMVTATIDLNATLAAGPSGGMPYLGAGISSRPALAHPRAVAITNNGDNIESDETIYVTEFFAQQKQPLMANAANADTNWVGVLYKIPLATKMPSIIEIPPMMDMGFQDHLGGTAGCFPNQLTSINIQGAFGYVTSTCASPKSPMGLYNGPAAKTCTTDAACPGTTVGACVLPTSGTCKGATTTTTCKLDTDCGAGAPAGSCVIPTTGTCKTTCAAHTDCAVVGGHCTALTGTDPSVGGTCDPNPSDIKTTTAPAISIIDLGGGKTFATVNLEKEFSAYFDVKPPYDQTASTLPMPLLDDATRRFPLLPADVGFVPGTVTAYVPGYGADAVFRIDFDATYAAATIDSLGDPKKKNPFMSLFSPAIDPSHNGQMPSGVAVAHATHTAGSDTRFAFTNNEHTRNVTVLDLSAQEIAGLSAGTPTTATASNPATDPGEIDLLEGKRKFVTGLGRWSWRGQAWQSCASCHADGLTDNVSWYTGRGPRQSPNIDGSFVKGTWTTGQSGHYRINSWEGVQDEISDHEGAIRNFSGGVGAIVKDMGTTFASQLNVPNQTGLNGSSLAVADPANPEMLATPSVLSDWKQIVSWGKTIRSPRRPTNLDPAKVAAGQALFLTANCQGCHGGPLWTTSVVFYEPDPTNMLNTKLKSISWAATAQLGVTAGFPATLLPVPNGLPTMTTNAMGMMVPTGFSGQTMRYSGTKGYEGMVCALRNVGTYGVAQAEAGVVEVRGSDLKTPSCDHAGDGIPAKLGDMTDCLGFNPPPLLNVVAGAPYFHGGNALSLEAVLSPTFAAHYGALAPAGFLAQSDPMRADKVAALIQFLLSIDGDTTPIPIPTPFGANGGVLCATQ